MGLLHFRKTEKTTTAADPEMSKEGIDRQKSKTYAALRKNGICFL